MKTEKPISVSETGIRKGDLENPVKVNCSYTRLASVALLVANPRNPNKHPPGQIELLAKIIKHQGWRAPITVSKRSGFVVTGHGRLEAAKLLGLETAPVDEQDFESEADEWAHLVADNRLAELAETDGALLKDLLIELDTGAFDMDLSGFDARELERVINYFRVEETMPPEMANGDRAPFRQVTFTLHDSQFEQVESAIQKAKSAGASAEVNENSNGNALAFICERFLHG